MRSPDAVRLILWIVGSIPIVWMSWRSLRTPASHGFYRFFAFESLWALLLVNVGRWLVDPLSPRQVLSWILLAASIVTVVWGFLELRQRGSPRGSVETTTRLVLTGPFRWIRHPLYASLILLAWGVFLKSPLPLSLLLTAAVTVFLYLTARTEERENLVKFGEEYAAMIRRTKMFLPFVF